MRRSVTTHQESVGDAHSSYAKRRISLLKESGLKTEVRTCDAMLGCNHTLKHIDNNVKEQLCYGWQLLYIQGFSLSISAPSPRWMVNTKDCSPSWLSRFELGCRGADSTSRAFKSFSMKSAQCEIKHNWMQGQISKHPKGGPSLEILLNNIWSILKWNEHLGCLIPDLLKIALMYDEGMPGPIGACGLIFSYEAWRSSA